jgi:hypothetical protein
MSCAAYLSRCWLTADLSDTRSEGDCAPIVVSPSIKPPFPISEDAPSASRNENLQKFDLTAFLNAKHFSIPTANVRTGAIQNT